MLEPDRYEPNQCLQAEKKSCKRFYQTVLTGMRFAQRCIGPKLKPILLILKDRPNSKSNQFDPNMYLLALDYIIIIISGTSVDLVCSMMRR